MTTAMETLPPADDSVERSGQSEGEQLLDSLVSFLRRYVVMSEPQGIAVALWIVHTHALGAAEQSPLLAITSAEKQSGKTRLLDVLELLVAKPWRVITPSEAVVFRKIDADTPTLLLDEVDAIFGPKASSNMEGLRALLNAGNRPGTMVPRCVGPSQELKSFEVFCPKALAGIRDLPDTVADRAIPIRLKRRAPGEPVQRFRRRDADDAGHPLYESVRSWAEYHAPTLTEMRPSLPDELSDRAQDAWEPLFAIADEIGGDWPGHARSTAVALSGIEAHDDESAGVRLLSDIRAIFATKGHDRISSATLAAELHELEESPWSEWYGKPITQHGIAKLLKHFEIRPRSVRLDDETTPKGYRLDQFEDTFARYLPEKTATTPQPNAHAGFRANSDRHTPELVSDENGPDSAWINGCGDVAVSNGDHGAGDLVEALCIVCDSRPVDGGPYSLRCAECQEKAAA
jgi:Protein of unknown function (DUF3631)